MVYSTGLRRFFAASISTTFLRKLALDGRSRSRPTEGIGIPLLLHAREGVSYLRPSLNNPSVKSDQRSLSLSSFIPTLSSLQPLFSFFLSPALPRSLFNFHWKPGTTGIIRTKGFLNVILVESRTSGAKSSGPSVHSNARRKLRRHRRRGKFAFSPECVGLKESR